MYVEYCVDRPWLQSSRDACKTAIGGLVVKACLGLCFLGSPDAQALMSHARSSHARQTRMRLRLCDDARERRPLVAEAAARRGRERV